MKCPGIVCGIIAAVLVAPDRLPARQQAAVTRIDQMPNLPSPYLMRSWRQVAQGYDSIAFNLLNPSGGEYLPLSWLNNNTVNYPGQSFGLHTVVGTTSPTSAEAINCLPAVVGATLTGIDKSNQNGFNWVLMSQEWFNKNNGQKVYKNHPDDLSGDDWWYETMPNVFFYQLCSMYPGVGDSENQFVSVANRWLQALYAMGAGVSPWRVPSMDHRGWYLSTMTPNDQDPHEPEAAGAVAWLLYNAYVKTGDLKSRTGAEWSMEFLNGQISNPSYELQLPYGVYTAARMNAEMGTTYDVQKMLSWCFDVGPLRSWGAMALANWGGYDCDGLIGEVNGNNNYAFSMNTFEQIGALVPLVRYDSRFARAIGKWVLNAANACRLFYPNYLPAGLQDTSYRWAHANDPNSAIAHEALRQFAPFSSNGPYETGDAISGGWGKTTLTLYSSSHVGILGGIIDTTNVPAILRLDLLKTDYFHANAYPSYLYYNPYDSAKTVTIDVGGSPHDIFDAVSKTFLRSGVTGAVSISIPADAPVVVVVTPPGGAQSYQLNKMLVDGIVVDYNSGQFVSNFPPRIKGIGVDSSVVLLRSSTRVYCAATDRDNDTLSYAWTASGGAIAGSDSVMTWTAPDTEGTYVVTCRVSDNHGLQDTASTTITVVRVHPAPPVITGITARPGKFDLGATTSITCAAYDPNGLHLSFAWKAVSGSLSGADSVVTWAAPAIAGNYYISCTVSNDSGGLTSDSVGIEVRDFRLNQTGNLVAYYPFTGGNANDATANHNDGTLVGTMAVQDRFGNPQGAISFNGATDYIRVPNHPYLNFQNGISISFWMKVGGHPNIEPYIVSHGSWQERWKVSLVNNKIRWTIKTNVGTRDLDSRTPISTGTYYDVVVLYGASDFEIWLNGNLDSFSSWSGLLQPSATDLTIAQQIPTVNSYNFQGVLDDVRIYDYALSVPEIQGLHTLFTAVKGPPGNSLPATFSLHQNFPNPFNPSTTIQFSVPEKSLVNLSVYDVLGRQIAVLLNSEIAAGSYSIQWSAGNRASGLYYCRLQTPAYVEIRSMLLIK